MAPQGRNKAVSSCQLKVVKTARHTPFQIPTTFVSARDADHVTNFQQTVTASLYIDHGEDFRCLSHPVGCWFQQLLETAAECAGPELPTC